MSLETIRISQTGRDQLILLKRRTGIGHWNILCRWAFCVSLADKTRPREERIVGDSSVEMTWRTFGGELAGVYRALLEQRCLEDGFGIDEKTLGTQFRLHVHRGIRYLAGNRGLKGIEQLIGNAI